MEAHIATLLPTQNRVVGADTNTTFLAHYDLNEYDVLRNIKTNGEANALSFSNAMVECPPLSISSFTGFSTEAWVYWDGTAGENIVYCQENVCEMKIDSGTGGAVMIAWSPYWGWVGDTTDASAKINANTWHHVAATYDGANQYIYLDGVQVYTRAQTGALVTNSNPFRIGARGSSGGPSSPFHGKIHNVRVWYRALSASEVSSLVTIPPVTEANGLSGWWRMNEGSGVTAPDYSPFHNDGRIQSATWTTGNSVFTLRPKEGYFGGSAMAIEEGTTNMLSGTALTFQSGWGGYGGNTVTLTQNMSVPEWGTTTATRFQSSGGTDTLKYVYQVICSGTANVQYASSIKVKNIGTTNFYVKNQYGASDLVTPGQVKYIQQTATFNGSSCYQFRFETGTASDSLDVIVYQPQAEQRSYSTSFVNGTRAVGNLLYSIPMAQNPFTINFWLSLEGYSGGYPWYFNMYPGGIIDGNNRIFFRPTDNVTIGGGRVVAGTVNAIPNGTVSDVTKGWHMYTLSSNGTTMNIYQDGNLITSSTSITDLPAGTNMLLELYQTTPSFSALIDELRIDNIQRTDAEISAWYYSASPFWPRGTYRKPY